MQFALNAEGDCKRIPNGRSGCTQNENGSGRQQLKTTTAISWELKSINQIGRGRRECTRKLGATKQIFKLQRMW